MTRWHSRVGRDRGFTLIELVVVMTIIAILAGALTINFVNRRKMAKRTRALQDMVTIETALDLYAADNGSAPTTEQGLEALITKPSSAPAPENWNGPYLKKRTVPSDPWNNEYVYRSPGEYDPEGYDLICYGEDGKPGGTSEWDLDITNYD